MNIFFRSLVSFWLATILALAGGIFLATSTQPGNAGRFREIPVDRLMVAGRKALADWKKAKSLKPERDQPASAIPDGELYLFDPDRKQILGAELPFPARQLSHKVSPTPGAMTIEVLPRESWVAYDLPEADGTYHAIVKVVGDRGDIDLFFLLNILSALVVSGIVFWLLARYFVQPVVALQDAAEAVAAGNFHTRLDAKLTRRKDEFGELSTAINFMIARIGELMNSQKLFLAQISHELGSPLTRLNLAIALARKQAPGLVPELNRIELEAKSLNSLVQQILLLARLEAQVESESDPELFLLPLLVDEVVRDAEYEAACAGKRVQLVIAQASTWAGAEMLGNRMLLKRAFENVVRNGLRYTPHGSEVEIECSVSNLSATLRVRDHGCGTPPEKLEVIFEPFVTIPCSQGHVGAGLGLAIARQAIGENGGTINARNVEPSGLEIVIELPVVSMPSIASVH